MRKPIVAGNWKMNTTVGEAIRLMLEMKDELASIADAECVICPPFISLQAIAELIKGTALQLGAQNMHFKEKGAYTGETSPLMLKGLCKYVILGHSERRQFFGETDLSVNEKVRSALSHDILPIMCVGESLPENESGQTRDVLSRQVTAGLGGIDANAKLVLAYEPIWAIGTGRAATSEQAARTIGFIRQLLSSVWGEAYAQEIRILYGGSVTNINIGELMSEAEIDGALVGGASLKAAEFISIASQTAAARAGK